MTRKCIEVEFLPGERVVIAANNWVGRVLRVSSYSGGCTSYKVEWATSDGHIHRQDFSAEQLKECPRTGANGTKAS